MGTISQLKLSTFLSCPAMSLGIWFFLGACPVLGQLSPGSLSRSHQTFDGPAGCTACHVFGVATPTFNCSGCHEEIRTRIQEGRGYHRRVAKLAAEGRDCVTCHKEHVGRDFQLIHWPQGVERFDHDETGYPLEGKHQTVECRTCHSIDNVRVRGLRTLKVMDPYRTFLGLVTTCGRCHQDEHRGQLDIALRNAPTQRICRANGRARFNPLRH